MESNWGRVFYSNFIACAPLLAHGAFDPSELPGAAEFTRNSVAALTVSCLLGVGMSYFAFLCRKLVSAASFTVIGNCCKIGTVAINLMIWDNHANVTGLCCLFACLACSYFYQQAPMRRDGKKQGSK